MRFVCLIFLALDFFEGNDDDSDIDNSRHSPPHGDWTTDVEVLKLCGKTLWAGFDQQSWPSKHAHAIEATPLAT